MCIIKFCLLVVSGAQLLLETFFCQRGIWIVGSGVFISGGFKKALQYLISVRLLNQGDRSQATTQLVQIVLRSQKDLEESHEGSKGNTSSPLLVYVLERLIGGLCSGRHLSHLGFSSALTVLLRDVEYLSVQGVWDLMEQKIALPSSMRGEEFRDNAIGRTLCCAALIQSGTLYKDAAMIVKIIKELTSLYERKAAMREMCSALIVDLFHQLDPESIKSVFDSCDQLQEVLLQDPEDAEAETTFLCLNLWGFMPNEILSRCQLLPKLSELPPRQWIDTNGKPWCTLNEASRKFFSLEHFRKVQDSLKRSSQSHPHMHSVWKPVLSLLLPSCGSSSHLAGSTAAESPDNVCKESLHSFWSKFLIPDLLGSTEERQFLAHRLIQILLPHIPLEQLPLVLGDECVRRISRQALSKGHQLQESAKECIGTISKVLSNCSGKLLSGPLVLMMKRLAKHVGLRDACSDILTKMKPSAMNEYLTTLMNCFMHTDNAAAPQQVSAGDGDDDLPSASANGGFSLKGATRDQILNEMQKAIKSSPMSIDEAIYIAKFLMVNGLFELDAEVHYNEQVLEDARKCSPPVASETKQLCCQCLVSMLPTLQWGVAKNCTKEEALLYRINQFIVSCKDLDGVDLVSDYSEREEHCHQTLTELTSYLMELLEGKREETKGTGTSKDCRNLVSSLLLSIVLSVYLWIEPGSIQSDTVDDFARFVAEAFGGKVEEVSESDSEVSLEEMEGPESNGGVKMVATSAKESHYTDSLSSMLLGISSKGTAPLKGKLLQDTAVYVFNSFASEMHLSGWLDILNSMNQFMRARGISNELDEEDSGSDLSDTPSNVKADEESDEEDESLEASPSNGAGTELRFEEISDGSGSSSESDLDDAAMFKMDSALAAALRSRREQREQQLGNVSTFFTTMLSCLKHHLRFHQKSPSTAFAAAELSYLLNRLDGKGGLKPMARSVENCIQLSLKCKPVVTDDLIPLLEEHTVRCLRAASKDKAGTRSSKHIRRALKFMIRCLDKQNHDASTRVMKKALHSVFDKAGKRLDISVVTELLSEVDFLRLSVLPELIVFSTSARNSYLKIMAMKLVVTCLGGKNTELVAKNLWPHLPALHDLIMHCASLSCDQKDRNIAALAEATRIVKNVEKLWSVGRPDVLKLMRVGDILARIEESIEESQRATKVLAKLKALKAALGFVTQHSWGATHVSPDNLSVA